jgi:hypothetical protein
MYRRRLVGLTGLLTVALLLAGCRGTGGGWIPGRFDEKASFGFNFQVIEVQDLPTRLAGSYDDGPVEFKGQGHLKRTAPPPRFPATIPCISGEPTYQSQNPSKPGTGKLSLTMCDLGEPGASPGDFISVIVLTGPYMGYQNENFVAGGNLQVQ